MRCQHCNEKMQLTDVDKVNEHEYHTCPKCYTGVSTSKPGNQKITVWNDKAPRNQIDGLCKGG